MTNATPFDLVDNGNWWPIQARTDATVAALGYFIPDADGRYRCRYLIVEDRHQGITKSALKGLDVGGTEAHVNHVKWEAAP
jgi:hypothetical protein